MDSFILQRREELIRGGLQTAVSGIEMINGEFLNRQQKQKIERLQEISCIGMFHNHNSIIARDKLRNKLLAKKMKKLTEAK